VRKTGTISIRHNGLAWRSARGLRAGQSGIGVFREAGRAYCLPGKLPVGLPVYQDHLAWRVPSHSLVAKEKWAVPEGTEAERNAKAQGRAEAVLASP